MSKVGERVGAILGGDDKRVKFLGYGVYEGDFVPPADAGGLGPLAHEMGMDNPRIKLDNGKTVWGCECWWGPEAKIKAEVDGYKARGIEVVTVDIDEVRKATQTTH